MRKILKNIRALSGIAASVLVLPLLVSCSDDGPDIDDGPDDEKEETAPVVDYLADRLVTNLCEVDSAGPLEILTPRLGEAIDGIATELSCSMADADAAFDYFYNTLVDAETGKEYLSGSETFMTYDLGRHGTVTYSRSNNAGEIAQISFDMPRLASTVKKIRILTPEAWPYNNDSPYGRGDVLLEKGTEYYWLVVREYSSGAPGIMMTVDYGWEVTWHSDHYKTYASYKKCAGKDAWDALADWWFYNNEDFRMELFNLQRIEKEERKGKRLGYVTDLFTRTVSIDRGQENIYQYGDTWDNKYYWWGKARRVWESRSNYVILGKKSQNGSNFRSCSFVSGSYYFKRSWSPVVPQHRNSNARYFSASEASELDKKYTIVYPVY